MSRLLCSDKLPVVSLEGDGPVLEPVEVQQGCVGSPSLSCLQAPSSLQTEQQNLKENLILCTDLLLRQDFYKLSVLMVMLLLRFTWSIYPAWSWLPTWLPLDQTPAEKFRGCWSPPGLPSHQHLRGIRLTLVIVVFSPSKDQGWCVCEGISFLLGSHQLITGKLRLSKLDRATFHSALLPISCAVHCNALDNNVAEWCS